MNSRYLKRLPSPLSLDIRLWWVDLDLYANCVPLEGLDAVDYEQAMRKSFRHDSRRSLASRHVLRQLIAKALGRLPEDLRILPDKFGKPQLSDRAVQFNLSHSGRYALVGVSHTLAIGVDIEILRPAPEVETIIAEHFTDNERATISSASGGQRDMEFFACWTRKEALAKALGTGFLLRPSLIDVGCSVDTRNTAIELGANLCEVTVASLEPSRALAAAVAVATPEAVELARDYVGSGTHPTGSSA